MSSAVNVGIYVQPKTGDVSVTGNVLPSEQHAIIYVLYGYKWPWRNRRA